VPRSSVSLVLGFRVRVRVGVSLVWLVSATSLYNNVLPSGELLFVRTKNREIHAWFRSIRMEIKCWISLFSVRMDGKLPMYAIFCLYWWKISPTKQRWMFATILLTYNAWCCLALGRFGFFKFGSIRFGFQSQVLGFVFFFVFAICTPPQCKSIPVCENTKTESINFHKKFQLKHIDWPRWVWRSYSSHLVWLTPSHSVRSVCLLICHNLEEFKNCITQIVNHIFCYLVRPQNRLWLPSEPRFRFRFGFYRKSQFRFRF